MATLSTDTIVDLNLTTEKNTYHVNCWADEATEAPTRIDAPAMLDAVGDVILENGTAIEGGDAKKFSEFANLFLTAKDQFMGGWWTSELSDSGARLWKLNAK